MHVLDATLFGVPSVMLDGEEIVLPYKKAMALLYYMVLKRKAARSELIGLLWDDEEAPTALKNLRHAIYSIRKAMGFDPFAEGQRTALEFNDSMEIYCDVGAFLEGDLDAYCGEFLANFNVPRAEAFDEWLGDQRNMLQTQYLRQLLSAEQVAFYAGDLEEAERLGLRYIESDPLEENAVLVLMQIYCAQKKFRKAIGLYHTLCRNLSKEFSISPLRETTALYYRIVDEWNTSTYRTDEQNNEKLFGKDHVLHKLLKLCNGTQDERKRPCCLIRGSEGVGKTYLLDYVLRQYDFSDRLVCRVSCYESEMHTALAPWNAVMLSLVSEVNQRHITIPETYMKSASSLFPSLSLERAGDFNAEENSLIGTGYQVAQDSALLVFSMIAKEIPMLVVFEDIHWMDPASAKMFSLFLHRLFNLDITVICTARDILPDYVREAVDSAERDKLIDCCSIYNFTREEAKEFVAFRFPGEYPEGALERIYDNTEGNPLLLTQLLATLSDRKDLESLPSDPQGIIALRLQGLSNDEHRLLNAVAVFPDWAPYDILSSILTIDPLELIYLCEQLRQKTILMESTANGVLSYAFVNDAIREAVCREWSESTARILHLRVAQCLETRADREHLQIYEQLIAHFTLGGNQFKAFEYKVRSIDLFAGRCFELLPVLYSDMETLDLDESGLLSYFDSLRKELQTLRITSFGTKLEELGELEKELLSAESRYCIHNGIYERGVETLNRLETLSRDSQDLRMLASTYAQFIHYAMQIYDGATFADYVGRALELGQSLGSCEETAGFLRLKGVLCLFEGAYEEAREWMRRSIEMFRKLDPEQSGRYDIPIAGAYNYMAETYRLEGKYEKAFETYDQAIVFNKSRGSYPGAAVIYTDYGIAAFQNGDEEEARSLFEYAEELYSSYHEYSQRPIALSYLAYFDVRDKAYEEAVERLRQAMEISDRIRSPRWKGETIYMLWRIRRLLEANGQRVSALEALWPQDPKEHCKWALRYLSRVGPRLEEREIKSELEALEGSTKTKKRKEAGQT